MVALLKSPALAASMTRPEDPVSTRSFCWLDPFTDALISDSVVLYVVSRTMA